MEELKSRSELSKARAKADTGLAIERVSRVKENEALAIERQAAAKKDEEIALLNMVKALKEIEQIDLGQLEKLIALSQQLSAPVVAGQETASQQNGNTVNQQAGMPASENI